MKTTYATYIALAVLLVAVGYFASTIPPISPMGWVAMVCGIILFAYSGLRLISD